ncbi:MAG: O-antigen ligase family protein [bacterium]|nr:O-antigen ligase family protein [bacterium]
MLDQSLIILFIALFTFLSWRKLDLGLFFIFLFLPSYLIRFKFAGIPSTLLEIIVWIVFLIYLAKIITNKTLKSQISNLKSYVKDNPSLFIAIILFLLAATISVFTSIDMRSALGEWKAFYIEPFLLFIVLISLPLSEGDAQGGQRGSLAEKILFALVLCGLATSLLAIYQHFTGYMVPWKFWENGATFRVTGWYGFPNGVGLFLAPIFPLAIYLTKNYYHKLKGLKRNKKQETRNKKQSNFKNWLIFVSCILYLVSCPLAVFFAKSTGGLIGILAGVGILLILSKKTRKYTLIFGILSFLIFILIPTNPIKEELLMQDRSGQLRINMWAETTEFLSDHPIKGAGLASYKTLIYPYRIDKWIEVFHHPHNIFLTMWVNLGLLGLLGFTWILVWFFRVGLQNLQATSYKLTPFLLASMTTLITTGLVDSPYIKNDLSIFFWLLPALLIFTTGQKQEKEIE